MVALQKYQKKRVAIYGMGLTGFSAARALKKLGAEILCWDDTAKVRREIEKFKFPVNFSIFAYPLHYRYERLLTYGCYQLYIKQNRFTCKILEYDF